MNLLEVIIPDINNFYILLLGDNRVAIEKYEKIDIEFCDRIAYRGGRREIIGSPMITYYVKMTKYNKDKLKTLFDGSDRATCATIQTRMAKIEVAPQRYIFNVEITARPDMGDGFLKSGAMVDGKIKICLKMENSNISLSDRIEVAYEKYNRFELLDIDDA